jgi:peptide/nickel transport system substrate-binding protein
MLKRHVASLLPLLLVLIVVVACAPQPAAQPVAQPAQPEEAPTEAMAEHPSTLVVVQNAEVRFMDPTLRPTTSDAHVIVNLYDGLVERDPDMKLVPGLATSWELVDDTTWEFKLREGVNFHNGEPFNADTVVAWFERLQTVGDRIQEYNSSISQIDSVDSVEKVDEYTVRFNTSIPDPVLPGRLSSYFLLVPPKEFIENNGDRALIEHGVGTGPYRFVEWVKDDHLTLEANPDYWGGEPAIKRIEFRPVPEPSSRVAALQAGEAQIADAIPPAVTSQIEQDPNLDVRSVPEATRTYWLYIDTTEGGPLADQRVRQALNYAVDKQTIIDEILNGQAESTASLVTFQSFGYCDVPEYEYDPEKAKELLAEAGYADGFDVKINYSPGHYLADQEIMQAIGNYLAEVGINVEYVPHEWANFLSLIQERNMPGLHYAGKTNLAIDADYMFAEFQPEKTFGWAYPFQGEIQDLYEREHQEMDDSVRADLACQIQHKFRDEAGLLFLWQQNLVFGVSSQLDWTPRADGFLYAVDMAWK